jgi:uncharacterized protein
VPSRPTGSISLLLVPLLLLIALSSGALTFGVATGIELLRSGEGFVRAAATIQRDPLLLGLCQLAGLVGATGIGVLIAFGADVRYREALDLEPVPTAIALLALTAGLSLQFPMHELATLIERVHPIFRVDPEQQEMLRRMLHIDSVREAITVPIALVAIPAISEELFFRGLLLPGLARRYGARVSLVVTSVLFGLFHIMPVAIVYATLAGFALGFVRQRTGSLLPCIAMHGAFNAVPILLPAELVRIEGFNTEGTGVYHLPLPLTLGSALVAIVSLLVIARLSNDTNAQ